MRVDECGSITRRRVVALASVACLLAIAGPVGAEPPADTTPFDTSLAVDRVGYQGWRIDVGAYRDRLAVPGVGHVCAEATRTLVAGRSKTVTSELTCTQVTRYRFDPIGWTASIDERVASVVHIERFRRVGAGWRRTSTSQANSSIDIDLAWTGRGQEQMSWGVIPPRVSVCYWPPGCVVPPWLTMTKERPAEVTGSIGFRGVGVTVPLPPGHAGSMRWTH